MNTSITRLLQISRLLVALLLFVVGFTSAHAQTGIYGEAGASKINFPSDQWTAAGTFGIYSDFYSLTPLVHIGADLRGSVLRPADNTTLFSVLVGPKITFHPHVVPLTPYVEALVGGGHYSFGNNVGPRTKLEYNVLGGVDHTILPHLDWRVVEFSFGGLTTFTSATLYPKTVSTGIVLRF